MDPVSLAEQVPEGGYQKQEGEYHHDPIARAVMVVRDPVSTRCEAKYHLMEVVGHDQKHREGIDHKRRPQGTVQPFFSLWPVQNHGQIQQRHRQGQLKEIVAVPAHPAQGTFLRQLVFEQAQQQPPNHQPAKRARHPADIPTDHPVGDRSLPQQYGGNDQQGG